MKKSYVIEYMVDDCHSKRIKLGKSIVIEYGIVQSDWDGDALLYFYLFGFWLRVCKPF